MSKLIKITQDVLEQCVKEFNETLKSGKFSDGKVEFTKTLGVVDRKATVIFTELAWQKMQALIRECNKEIGWHGVAKRGEEKDQYIISDILLYPQEVTGATVTTDQEEYQMWLMQQEDEIFNNIRMQGHSHVTMPTTPSTVDLSLYERILDQLDDDMFYIFMIYNKNGSKTIKIYDMRENVLFETTDVTVSVLKEENGVAKILEDMKDLVKTKTYTTTTTHYNGYSGTYGNYDGYGGYSAGSNSKAGHSEKKEEKKEVTSAKTGVATSVGSEKSLRKGRRNKKSAYSYYDDDDYYTKLYGIR